MTNAHIGVMLITYGSPATLEDIPTYLKNIRGGRQPDDELIAEFRRRYTLIGGSPLVRITREQAAALQDELRNQHPDGPSFTWLLACVLRLHSSPISCLKLLPMPNN